MGEEPIVVGSIVMIVHHDIWENDPEFSLSNYEGYGIGTTHVVTCILPDDCYTLDHNLSVFKREIQLAEIN